METLLQRLVHGTSLHSFRSDLRVAVTSHCLTSVEKGFHGSDFENRSLFIRGIWSPELEHSKCNGKWAWYIHSDTSTTISAWAFEPTETHIYHAIAHNFLVSFQLIICLLLQMRGKGINTNKIMVYKRNLEWFLDQLNQLFYCWQNYHYRVISI